MKNLFYIILIALCTSCLGTKKVVENTTAKKEMQKKEVKKDSSNVVEKNQEISDQISLSLRTNNKKVDSIIRQRLKGFNSSKKSGSNRYNAVFDYEKMALNIAAVIGATQNQTITTDSNTNTEKSFEERTNEYIKKRITTMPWYLWVVIYFFFLDGKIVGILANFIPQLKGATSILSLFKKNDNKH